MSKVKSEMATRCELALMGKVVPVNSNDEVQMMTCYLLDAMGRDSSKCVDILENAICKYSKTNEVKYLVCNTVMGMKCITYLLASTSDNEEENSLHHLKKTMEVVILVLSAMCLIQKVTGVPNLETLSLKRNQMVTITECHNTGLLH